MAWAVKWRTETALDGKREHLVGCFGLHAPTHLAGHTITVFRTRDAARQWINRHYGYIRQRPGLRAEPHGWRMPIPVKVEVEIREVSNA